MNFKKSIGKNFDKEAKLYNSARKDYPLAIFKDIRKITKLNKKSRILDAGCGTGKSSKFFVQRGYQITCLEPGKNLIDIAKKEFEGKASVKFINASFEKAILPKNTFEIILAGQSFHYFDTDKSFKKIKECLKKGGYFAIFAKFAGNKLSPFGKEIRNLFVTYCKKYPGGVNAQRYIEKYSQEFSKRRDNFERPIIKAYAQRVHFSKKEYRGLIFSFSWVIDLKKSPHEKFIQELNKILDKQTWPMEIPYESVLLIAKVKK